ncbi:SRPBCC domain-containing protein [uncultured Paraglaciecola sp.]|uniref:SRPBCC domain-containing protein n=1 Tax=uncultured Paraglaciecola sp. TaxID=1765024 RepID=UPI0030D77E7D|tara:strand:+ start:57299 stop:57718 length:420 start_codon:yes stop_codon:yes gene_type:complete
MEVSIETEIATSIEGERGGNAWVTPDDITSWNFATDEWCCPEAKINLVASGQFNYRMEAKDGSIGFDFEGEFTSIERHKLIHYKLQDDRKVKITFIETEGTTKVIETFEAEDEFSAEQQRLGWLGILSHFKQHVESKHH